MNRRQFVLTGLSGLSSTSVPGAQREVPRQRRSRAFGIRPVQLRCEYLTDPLGIDVPLPRLSWVLESSERGQYQRAYHVLVSSEPALLAAGKGDLWDSGKVESDQSIQVVYGERPLPSRMRCWWKVRVWDKDGAGSVWSAPAQWSMGLLDAADWSGQWIGAKETPDSQEQNPAILLRRELTLSASPAHVTAYISGLGYSELYVNGKKIGDHVLDPAFTNYDKSVTYVAYDLSGAFQVGRNAIGVMLGNGWYHSPTPDLFGFEKAPWKAKPKLLLNIDIEYPGGKRETIASDNTWKCSTGPIVFNCIRAGEIWDARLEKKGWNLPKFDDSSWSQAETAAAPAGRLVAQKMAPMRVTETVRPLKLTEPKPGVYIFDFGLNLTGWARIVVSAEPGRKIRLDYNEMLLPDGTLNTKYSHSHTYGRFQTDEFILGDSGKGVFEPRFTYHGFRYVQVTGLTRKPALESVIALGVHTDWKSQGEFTCSNQKINLLQKAARRTLNNSCHSIPGEEATREKMGWTQDGLNVMESAVYNFDATAVYTKYLHDMIDAQEENGHVPPIVPTNGWGLTKPGGAPPDYSDPWWGGTLPYVAWKLYEYYGDRRALEEAYEPMRRWAEYLRGTARNNLVDWWLGDWQEAGSNGRPKRTTIIETSTAGYFYCVRAVARAAALLGKTGDAGKYDELAQGIRESYNRSFFHPESGEYARDSQTSMALSLWLGLVPEDKRELVLTRLVENIHAWRDHTSAGFVGIMPEMFGLVDWGHSDLAYRLATQEDHPGWWQMIADGNSTLGEALDKLDGSRHHPFGSCIGAWYYRAIAGIRADSGSPGFKRIEIKPELMGDLRWARAAYDSMHGRIASAWSRAGNQVRFDITIPVNTSAMVYIPARTAESVTEQHKPAAQSPGVEFLRMETNRAIFRVGSGAYSFVSTAPEP